MQSPMLALRACGLLSCPQYGHLLGGRRNERRLICLPQCGHVLIGVKNPKDAISIQGEPTRYLNGKSSFRRMRLADDGFEGLPSAPIDVTKRYSATLAGRPVRSWPGCVKPVASLMAPRPSG